MSLVVNKLDKGSGISEADINSKEPGKTPPIADNSEDAGALNTKDISKNILKEDDSILSDNNGSFTEYGDTNQKTYTKVSEVTDNDVTKEASDGTKENTNPKVKTPKRSDIKVSKIR